MAQLRNDYEQIKALDTEVLVAGPEEASIFQSYWRRESLPFPGLPDPDLKILNLYGQQMKLFKLGRMPAQVLVDLQGIIRFAHYGSSMSDIPSTGSILDEIGRLQT